VGSQISKTEIQLLIKFRNLGIISAPAPSFNPWKGINSLIINNFKKEEGFYYLKGFNNKVVKQGGEIKMIQGKIVGKLLR